MWTAVGSIVTKLKHEGRPPRERVDSVPVVDTTTFPLEDAGTAWKAQQAMPHAKIVLRCKAD